MKRVAAFFAIMLMTGFLFSSSLIAQSAKEIFNSPETPITYLGIDFTQARLIGDAAAVAPDLKDRHFPGINQVVVNEPKKYDLAKAFKRESIATDITVTESVNATIEADKIKSSNKADESRLNATDIQKVVNNYKLDGKKGVGLVFIMEGLSKTAEKGSMYVTFIDMATKKVLFTERMTGKAGGFGYKNYWVKPVYEVLKDIEKSKYKEWKSKNA